MSKLYFQWRGTRPPLWKRDIFAGKISWMLRHVTMSKREIDVLPP